MRFTRRRFIASSVLDADIRISKIRNFDISKRSGSSWKVWGCGDLRVSTNDRATSMSAWIGEIGEAYEALYSRQNIALCTTGYIGCTYMK